MTGTGIARIAMLRQQLQIYEDIFKELATSTKEAINTQQKEVNRAFVPVIAGAMHDAYEVCVNEVRIVISPSLQKLIYLQRGMFVSCCWTAAFEAT